MPDIGSTPAAEPASTPQPPPSTESASTPSIHTGSQNKFSYTKNWGEVSDTLRKKLRKRLSALKESDDNSGDEDRAYRSDRSQADGARSPPDSMLSGRSGRAGSPHERSPDVLLGADGLSSVRHSRAAIWQKISSAAAAPVTPAPGDRPGARFNRVGTAFQGMYVAPARVDRTRVEDESSRARSGTPDREYRSLAAFITRSATPERLRARSRSNTPGAGRASRAETPERHASVEGSPRTDTRGRQERPGSSQRSSKKQEDDDTTTGDASNGHGGDGDHRENKNSADDGDDETHDASSNGGRTNKPVTNQDDNVESPQTGQDLEDDADDENCLACKTESQLGDLDISPTEDALNSPRSVRSGRSNRKSPEGSVRDKPDEVLSNGSSSTISKKESPKSKIKESGDDRPTSKMSRTVTHFVEVTSVEDGNKRITYVENGITVEPVIVSKNKGSTAMRTKTKTPAPKAIKEEEDIRSQKSLPVDSESVYSSKSSKSKRSHSPSHSDNAKASDAAASVSQPDVSDMQTSPSSSVAAVQEHSTNDWPLEPGPHTGAIPKRRDKYGTRVVKFPKDRSRGRRDDSPSVEAQEGSGSQPSDQSNHRRSSSVSKENVVESSRNGDSVKTTNGSAENSPTSGGDRGQSWKSEAEIQRGSVAKRQALYESISEVNAARGKMPEPKQEQPPPPPARPAVMPPAPTSSSTSTPAPVNSNANGNETTPLEPPPAAPTVTEEPASGGASSAAGSDTNGVERNYRLRRSALEALPVRVPTVKELLSSRFTEPEPVADLEHGHADVDLDEAWIVEPLDEEHQGAESDGDSSNHSQNSQDSANHSAGSAPSVDDGKHSLLQYAMTHFRDAEDRYNLVKDDDGTHSKLETKNKKNKKKGKEDWTWREQVELVKWTDRPLGVSLLKLGSPDLTRLAVESFTAIQRYMGDQAMPRDVTDVDCVYTVLMACHRYTALRDEVYCQLMRQTTSNRSAHADSCERGWRMMSLVAAFFGCSDNLRPYLTKYLETAATDPRRAHRETASVCLQSLRRTLRLGGRRNVPSEQEVAAVTAGRTARRQRYLLPGGTQRVVNTRCTTVVQDVLTELCKELGVTTDDEREEYSLYCVVEGDVFTLPLARHEYILDVTTELQRNSQVFHLVLCRAVWFFPLRLDSPLYVDVAFSQAVPDYLEGLLLVLPAETLPQRVVFDIARVAALLHRAAGLRTMPTMKETKYLLPKAALLVRDIKPPQWVTMVQDSWSEVQEKTAAEARRAVLETLSTWPLFGSAFFVVGAPQESRGEAAADRLLAVNSRGLHLLDTVTHETQSRYPFNEVLSTRRVRSDAGDLFIDIKVGTPKQTKVIRLQSENAAEIARLIRQYSGLEQRCRPITERPAETRERQVSR